jgi:hypothetical protein
MQNSEPVPLRIDGQESLTTEESSRLNQLEIVIEKGARSVGEARYARSANVSFTGRSIGPGKSTAISGGDTTGVMLTG